MDDPLARAQFTRSVKKVEDMKVALGAWQPTSASSHPRWEVLQKALVWTADTYAGLRAVLSQRRKEWAVNDSAEGVVSVSPEQVPGNIPCFDV